MSLAVKICGMTDSCNTLAAVELRPQFLGFIFYKGSPRYAEDKLDPEILRKIPGTISRTGVFVDAGADTISESISKYSLDCIQLHGNEEPGLCLELKEKGVRIIKAFSTSDGTDLEQCHRFIGCTDFFLFDTRSNDHGGSGKKFNWEILNDYKLKHPFFLSGGIGPEDADEIFTVKNPWFYGVDLNSRFESEPGFKDIWKLKNFIREIKKRENSI
jgi:phosphoribosylanthranilate isomerase